MASKANNHREDLRGELAAAAEAVLRNQGHEAISMRSLALEVGVSSGAPYKHFPDRRALLAVLALEGFDALLAAARKAMAAATSPAEVLTAVAEAFLAFCDAEPNMAALMYDSELTRPVDDRLRPSYQAAFTMLVEAVEAATGTQDRQVVVGRAIAFWSTLFGLARLSRNQLLDPFQPEPPIDWRGLVVEQAVAAVLRAPPV